MTTEQIHVALQGEGTEVWRPVEAMLVSKGLYQIKGTQAPDEIWQFPPGTLVRCELQTFANGECGLVAKEELNHLT